MPAPLEDISEPSEAGVRKSMAVRRGLLILAVPVILFYTVFWFDRFRILAEKKIEIDGKQFTVQVRKHHANVFVRILGPGGDAKMAFAGDGNRADLEGKNASITFERKSNIVTCRVDGQTMRIDLSRY